MRKTPAVRIEVCNDAPVERGGAYVLYWMTAQRRVSWNFAFDRAVEWSRELGAPLLVLEALRAGYRWASDRLHTFVVQGMADNARRLQGTPVRYYAYVEDEPGAGRGLLERLARDAAIVVTDDFPAFFIPRMIAAAAARLPIRLEKVDSNGLLPLRAADSTFATAYAFRRFLQRQLPGYLSQRPKERPLAGIRLPELDAPLDDVIRRWPDASAALGEARAVDVSRLPIDHSIAPVSAPGGPQAGREALRAFLDARLPDYAERRNEPGREATSGLSSYLHFGHISAHEVFAELARRQDWDLDRLATKADGSRRGWWGMTESAEGFLDQLVTWRELGFNMSARRDDYDTYESLPDWARGTLEKHAGDPRPYTYTLGEFENGRTQDELWNAAQTQLVREGRIHNYLRMLWGKKILEWSPTPRDALSTMVELNNKYALDGRDPNSYSGIFWCFGRYDRPWGPERSIFGTVRYMSSENTARKYRVGEYLERYASR